MKATFDPYFEWLLPWEGTVYENDPDDQGGATKYGIDQRSHPDVNIRNLTREKAKAIYFDDYWLPVRGPEVPTPLDAVLMDIAVNNGRTRAIQWLQRKVGTEQDGVFGRKTFAAVSASNPRTVANHLLTRRDAFYRAIATGRKRKFLRGWLNRNNSLKEFIAKQTVL